MNQNSPFFSGVKSSEVVSLLADIAKEKITLTLSNSAISWSSIESGNIEFKANGWTIKVFSDCGSFDYVDSVIAPDGRKGSFNYWIDKKNQVQEPSRTFLGQDKKAYFKMESLFKALK